MSDFLSQMQALSVARVREARSQESLAALRQRAMKLPEAPPLRLHDRFDLIAEFKRHSPALGALGTPSDDIEGRVRAYANAGAAAVSVLTEPVQFHGNLSHLVRAAAALAPLGVPVMRKDFLVDPYQLYEARAAGAGGALLIVRMLPAATLGEMIDCARELGLFVLLECFDEADIEAVSNVIAVATDRTRPGSGGGIPSLRDKALRSETPTATSAAGKSSQSADRSELPGFADTAGSADPICGVGFQTARVAAGGRRERHRDARGLQRDCEPGLFAGAGRRRADEGGGSRRTGQGDAGGRPGDMNLLVKICGIRDEAGIQAAVAAGADAIGFVFHADSPRNIEPAQAARLAAMIPAGILRVAVTLRPQAELVARVLDCLELDAWQSELADFSSLSLPGSVTRWPVLRSNAASVRPLPGRVLFEGAHSGRGEVADWRSASSLARRTELILGGGLSPMNVGVAVAQVRPFGVDVSSGVESAPGIKDATLIAKFVAAARAAAAGVGND